MFCNRDEIIRSGFAKKYKTNFRRKPAWVRRRLILTPYFGANFHGVLEVRDDIGRVEQNIMLHNEEFFLVSGPALARMTKYKPPEHFTGVDKTLTLGVCTRYNAAWFAFESKSELLEWIDAFTSHLDTTGQKNGAEPTRNSVISAQKEGLLDTFVPQGPKFDDHVSKFIDPDTKSKTNGLQNDRLEHSITKSVEKSIKVNTKEPTSPMNLNQGRSQESVKTKIASLQLIRGADTESNGWVSYEKNSVGEQTTQIFLDA